MRRLAASLAATFGRTRLDREFDEELAAHLALLVEENRRRGMEPDEARRRAMIALGGVGPTRELHRDTRGLPLWDTLAQDVRYAFRTLGRERGFFAAAVLIIGLGIGATTAIFSVLDAVLLRPLPFREPERLARVANAATGGLSAVTSRSANLRDWRRRNESFEDLAGYFAFFDYGSYNLVGRGAPERLVGVGVTENFLDLLGVAPELGRNFVHEECVWNGPPAALLTHGLWERRFSSDRAIVGKAITLNGKATVVVGVLPRSFDFASVFSPGSRIDLLTPFPIADETDRWGNTLAVIGRLKPGVTTESAQAELDLINQRLQEADPGRWGLGAVVSPLREHIAGQFRPALIVLGGAVGLVLLIVCANLSNLLLARAASRRKEIAVRSALGAHRGRLVRQTLTESLVLSGCGALLGVLVALAVTRVVSATTAVSIPLLRAAEVNVTALVFTVIVAVATGLLFGSVPALQISGGGEHDALRDANRGSTGGKRRTWIRGALVVSEVALACMLLVGAGLLLRSFLTLLEVDLGFRPEHAIAWRVDAGDRYPKHPDRVVFYERLLNEIRAVPGVESVGMSDTLPLGRNRSWGIAAKGAVYARGEYPNAFPRMVDSGYIETMGIPLVAGRDFSEDDTTDNAKVIIVNETAARRLWPGRDPIGQLAILGDEEEWRVVGIVRDVRHSSLEEEASPEMYMHVRQQEDWGAIDVVIRTTLPVERLAATVRSILRKADPALPTDDVQTLGQIVDRAVSPRRFVVYVIGAFALMAALLASLGIYGVISYAVTQRTQEIGIRMALGASPGNVRRQVITNTLVLASVGVLLGLAGSIALARLMSSLLFGITPADPLTLAVTVATLTLIAGLAGSLPAHRASRTDPIAALRSA
ncbi:MAG: FtsX-like permease family protein [Luteitalea sp.]|nr:FtsX-like permease family protein [Luteitalea sp.]